MKIITLRAHKTLINIFANVNSLIINSSEIVSKTTSEAHCNLRTRRLRWI